MNRARPGIGASEQKGPDCWTEHINPSRHVDTTVIVVATADFECYHEVVGELQDRDLMFTTVEPDDPIPAETRVVLTDEDSDVSIEGTPTVVAEPGSPRQAVDAALATLRGDAGRTVIGVDPGRKPAIAVLSGDIVVATFQVPLSAAVETIRREMVADSGAIVRVGDGARHVGARVVNELEDVRVELVDETGTTPYLGTGSRGMGDVVAAINIARLEGETLDRREIDPTEGELQRIKDRSREQSDSARTIDEDLARRVAAGELTIEEALERHDS